MYDQRFGSEFPSIAADTRRDVDLELMPLTDQDTVQKLILQV